MSEIFDVTLMITDSMITWPTDPKVKIRAIKSLATGDSSTVSFLELSSHTGTHIDAPYHFFKNGKTVEDLPLDVLVGLAIVVEIPETREGILPQDFQILKENDWHRILLKTRNSNLWREKKFRPDFQYLTREAAQFLIKKGVKLVGIDYLSIEKFGAPHHPVHHLLLKNNVVIVEGLNLSEITPGQYELFCLPLKIKGGDGAPARVILIKP